MWTNTLAASHADKHTVFVSVNPGSLLGSKMVKQGFGVEGKSLLIGADILVRAALADEFTDANGKYYDNDAGCFASPQPDALNQEKCQQLTKTIITMLDRCLMLSGH